MEMLWIFTPQVVEWYYYRRLRGKLSRVYILAILTVISRRLCLIKTVAFMVFSIETLCHVSSEL